jgi:hypothetical protein
MLKEVAHALWRRQREGLLGDRIEPDRHLHSEALALACRLLGLTEQVLL